MDDRQLYDLLRTAYRYVDRNHYSRHSIFLTKNLVFFFSKQHFWDAHVVFDTLCLQKDARLQGIAFNAFELNVLPLFKARLLLTAMFGVQSVLFKLKKYPLIMSDVKRILLELDRVESLAFPVVLLPVQRSLECYLRG